MKRTTLTIVFLCYLSMLAFSQVGIGTINPASSAMLDVSSTTKGFLAPRLTTAQRIVLGTIATDGLMVYDTETQSYWFWKAGTWSGFIGSGSGTGSVNRAAYWSTPGSLGSDDDFFWNSTEKCLGLGTMTPTVRLQVLTPDKPYGMSSGVTKAMDALYVKAGRGGGLEMQGGDAGYGAELTVSGGSGAAGGIHGGSGGLLSLKSGNGGDGGGGIGGNGGNIVLESGSGGSGGSKGGDILLLPGAGDVEPGGVGIGVSYTEEKLHLRGAMLFDPISIPGNTVNRLYNSDGFLYFGDLDLTAAHTLASTYVTNGNTVHMTPTVGNIRFFNDDEFFPEIFFLDHLNGFTGMGTTSPIAKLDIRHGIGMEFGDVTGINVDVVGGENANGIIANNNGGGSSGMGWAGQFTSSASNGGGTMWLRSTGGEWCRSLVIDHGSTPDLVVNGLGNIGIGTINPTKRFEVNLAEGSEEIRFRGNGGGASPNFFTVDDGDGIEYIRCDGGSYNLYMNPMHVGIGTGTTIPTAKFHVNGSIRFENMTGSGTVVGIDVNGNLSKIPGTDARIGSQTLNYIPRWNGSALVTGSVFDNGSVGIGTNSPNGKFSVRQGNKQLDIGLFYGQGSIGLHSDDGIIEIGDGAGVDGVIKLINSGGGIGSCFSALGYSYILDGNFGLGIETPSAQFHTTGTVRFAGLSGTGNVVGIDASGYLSKSFAADPRIGAQTLNYLPRWNGAALVTSSIFDNGNIGIGTNAPGSKVDIVSSASATTPAVKINQQAATRPFIQYEGTNTPDIYSGNITSANQAGAVQGPRIDDGTYTGWYYAGMVKVNVNGGEYWMPYYYYDGCGKAKASCPRVDAWIDGRWVMVGRAIEHQNSKEKDGRHDIKLNVPAQKFRLVEDESEISYVHKIVGDGQDWGLGEIITTPSSAYGVDGFTVEFRFDKPVTLLETYGYYEFFIQEK